MAAATGYKLRRNGVVIYDGPDLTFADTGLRNGVIYTYTVSAYNDYGESAESEPVEAMPHVPAPSRYVLRTYSRPSESENMPQGVGFAYLSPYEDRTPYLVVQRITDGNYWRTSADETPGFEPFDPTHWTRYAMALTRVERDLWTATIPFASLVAGELYVISHHISGLGEFSPAEPDQRITAAFLRPWGQTQGPPPGDPVVVVRPTGAP